MRKTLILLFTLLLSAPLVAQNTDDIWRAVARAQTQKATFADMRPTLPPDTKPNNVAAYATYLHNMYIWHEIYGNPDEKTLSLNYLGVAESISHWSDLRTKNALEFYRKHQADIQTRIGALFLMEHKNYPKNTALEEKWITLLQGQDFHSNRYKLLYTYPEVSLLPQTYAQADVAFLIPAIRTADTIAQQKVILFERTQATLESLDTRLASGGGRNKPEYTYRWVKDECEYSSYLLGVQLLQTAQNNPQKWNQTRVYKITARPAKNEFYLRPAQGERFTLSGGSPAAKWQYHTAILVVLNTQEGAFVPVVLDNFLGSAEDPIALAQWVSAFDKTTQFEVVPFARNEKVEEAIQTPDEIIPSGQLVRANKHTYKPAPIEE